jgi:AcrR family transcriptional regulator
MAANRLICGNSCSILGAMRYLSERLNATMAGEGRGGEGARQRAVAFQQRQRLLDATEQLLAERGCAGTTIERIAKRAKVSSVTFYDLFADKEEVFLAAFERAVEETREALAKGVPAGLPWPEQVREGLRVLLGHVAAEPERARMFLVEGQKGGPALLERHERALDLALPKLHEGRLLGSAAEDLPEALEEATVAGVAWLLRERLETRGAEAVEEMLPRLAEVVLGPYLGGPDGARLSVAGGRG